MSFYSHEIDPEAVTIAHALAGDCAMEAHLGSEHPSAVAGVCRMGFEDSYTIDETIADRETARQVSKALGSLSSREERVLRMRYGIGCDEQSLDEIASSFSVSRERIRQIEAKALRKLKHPSRSRALAIASDANFRAPIAPRPYQPTERKHVWVDEFVPAYGSWREAVYQNECWIEWEGGMRKVLVTGISTEPEVCADFGGVDAVLLFELDGQKMGEAWRDAKRVVPRLVAADEIN